MLDGTGRSLRDTQQIAARDVAVAEENRAVDGRVQRRQLLGRDVGAARGSLAVDRIRELDLVAEDREDGLAGHGAVGAKLERAIWIEMQIPRIAAKLAVAKPRDLRAPGRRDGRVFHPCRDGQGFFQIEIGRGRQGHGIPLFHPRAGRVFAQLERLATQAGDEARAALQHAVVPAPAGIGGAGAIKIPIADQPIRGHRRDGLIRRRRDGSGIFSTRHRHGCGRR